MPVGKVRSDHDALKNVSSSFKQNAETTKQTTQNLKSKMEVLRGKDWVGKGAAKFYQEMDSSVFPSLKRLSVALDKSSQLTLKISQIMKQAEDDAAALFKSGDSGSGGGSAGG